MRVVVWSHHITQTADLTHIVHVVASRPFSNLDSVVWYSILDPLPVSGLTLTRQGAAIRVSWQSSLGLGHMFRITYRPILRNSSASWSKTEIQSLSYVIMSVFPGELYDIRVFAAKNSLYSIATKGEIVISKCNVTVFFGFGFVFSVLVQSTIFTAINTTVPEISESVASEFHYASLSSDFVFYILRLMISLC